MDISLQAIGRQFVEMAVQIERLQLELGRVNAELAAIKEPKE